MAVTQIPAHEYVTCDACMKRCDNKPGDAHRARSGRLVVQKNALDAFNMPCSDATCKFDLCDACLSLVEDSVNKTVIGIRGLCNG
jgi:hypothetical protein